jgi:hypothetical protein
LCTVVAGQACPPVSCTGSNVCNSFETFLNCIVASPALCTNYTKEYEAIVDKCPAATRCMCNMPTRCVATSTVSCMEQSTRVPGTPTSTVNGTGNSTNTDSSAGLAGAAAGGGLGGGFVFEILKWIFGKIFCGEDEKKAAPNSRPQEYSSARV